MWSACPTFPKYFQRCIDMAQYKMCLAGKLHFPLTALIVYASFKNQIIYQGQSNRKKYVISANEWTDTYHDLEAFLWNWTVKKSCKLNVLLSPYQFPVAKNLGCTCNWVHFGLTLFFCNPLVGSDDYQINHFSNKCIHEPNNAWSACPIKGHTNIPDPD